MHPCNSPKNGSRCTTGDTAYLDHPAKVPVISKEAPHRSCRGQIVWRRLRNLLSVTARHAAALGSVGLPSAAAFRRSGLSVSGSRFLGRAKVRCVGKLRVALPRNDSAVPRRAQWNPASNTDSLNLVCKWCAPLAGGPWRATPRTVISRERRTALATAPHPGRDREIYCRHAGGRIRRSGTGPVRPCGDRTCGAGCRVWPRGSRE
jgi:hypothetical protein